MPWLWGRYKLYEQPLTLLLWNSTCAAAASAGPYVHRCHRAAQAAYPTGGTATATATGTATGSVPLPRSPIAAVPRRDI